MAPFHAIHRPHRTWQCRTSVAVLSAQKRAPKIELVTNRPEIVCICGSARFVSEMRAASWELSCSGVIVVAPSETDEAPTPEQKAVLDDLHLRKIDLADRVLIINPDGYVGESTRREIAYAQSAGKPVTFTDLV